MQFFAPSQRARGQFCQQFCSGTTSLLRFFAFSISKPKAGHQVQLPQLQATSMVSVQDHFVVACSACIYTQAEESFRRVAAANAPLASKRILRTMRRPRVQKRPPQRFCSSCPFRTDQDVRPFWRTCSRSAGRQDPRRGKSISHKGRSSKVRRAFLTNPTSNWRSRSEPEAGARACRSLSKWFFASS